MQWFAVRMLVRHCIDGRGHALYEERIFLYRAIDESEAINAADEDASKYLELNPSFLKAGPLRAFVLSDDIDDLHRCEVWSQIVRGVSDVEAFYHDRYARFELTK